EDRQQRDEDQQAAVARDVPQEHQVGEPAPDPGDAEHRHRETRHCMLARAPPKPTPSTVTAKLATAGWRALETKKTSNAAGTVARIPGSTQVAPPSWAPRSVSSTPTEPP